MEHKDQSLAVAMGTHTRLGAKSPVVLLSRYLIQDIVSMARKKPYIFAIGSWVAFDKVVNVIHRYDVERSTWHDFEPPPMRVERLGSSVAAVGSRLFVFGGRNSNRDWVRRVDVYDAGKDTWTTTTPMPKRHRANQVVVAGGCIYTVDTHKFDGCPMAMERYDPKSNVWTKVAAPSQRVYGFAAVGVGDSIFYFGGCGGGIPYAAKVLRYDSATDAWADVGDMPGFFGGHAIAAIGNDVYITGGYDKDYIKTNTVWCYNVETRNWSPQPSMIEARYCHAAVTVDDKIVVMGQGTIESYDPATKVWTALPELSRSQFALPAAVCYV
jgi:N-acetylneuraminic acid mutarotase